MNKYLKNITSPEDIKKLTLNELNELSAEIRDEIIEVVSKNGGHLASNLGVVELTLAIHRTCDAPYDKIIWDVGHQSYTHKLITGRYEYFKTLRQNGGMSGFPKRHESEYDVFDAGHSSNSISAAIGLACARDLAKEKNNIIAVIGDGAMTGGMAFEALNHAGDILTNLIVILNDNQMAISKNTGGLSYYLGRLSTTTFYFNLKKKVKKILYHIPIIGKMLARLAEKFKDALKYIFVPGIMFEELGFKYMGPVDGHDIKEVSEAINRAKKYTHRPVLIHVITKKGKGYDFAEQKPEQYHGVGAFDIYKGVSETVSESYSTVAGEMLIELADNDDKIIAISAAMPDGCGLTDFVKKYPSRFFDVGIAEQHAVTFAAGLAIGGYKPFFFVYSTFLQRAYDQVIQDASMQQFNITFCVDRAGLVGNDGETHHGVFDIAYLSNMPGLTIMSPKDFKELKEMMTYAANEIGPMVIRYPRGNCKDIDCEVQSIIKGESQWLMKQGNILIIAEGKMVHTALNIAKKFKAENIDIAVVNIRFIKPLDIDMLRQAFGNYEKIYTLEDGIEIGGMGSNIAIACIENDIKMQDKLKIFAYKDEYVEQGTVDELYKIAGMDVDSIYNKINKDLKR